MYYSSGLPEIRLALVDARATLRTARDTHEIVKAEAEQRAVDAGATGRNAEERGRALTLALARDARYSQALAQLRRAEAEAERLEALLEGARDARRVEEWTIRARLADALGSTQSDDTDPTGDAAFDDAATERATQARLRAQREMDELFPEKYTPPARPTNGRVINLTRGAS